MINVSEALDSDTAGVVMVKRTHAGAYVDGIYVPGKEAKFKTLCSVQQPTNKQAQFLTEGERSNDPRVFITKKPLRTVSDKDGIAADVVIYRGNDYKVIADGDWADYGYTSVIGVRT